MVGFFPPEASRKPVQEWESLCDGCGLCCLVPLVSGSAETVHEAGVSVRGQTVSETTLREAEDALDFEASEWAAERGGGRSQG